MRIVLAAVVVLLAACGEVREVHPEATPFHEAVTPDAPPIKATPAPKCRRASPAWLVQRPAAEGSILHTFEVSKARRTQIEQLNAQLAKIAAALNRGCLEAP